MDVTFPRAMPFPHGVGVLIYYVIKVVFFQAAFKKIFPGDSPGWAASQVEPPEVKCSALLDINHLIFQRQQKWYRSNLFPVGKK